MNFTVREANKNDVSLLFDMFKEFHKEMNTIQPFILTQEQFIKDSFNKNTKAGYFVTEFKGKVLGYCSYVYSYNILSGPFIIITNIYLKKEYRKIGISVFLFSKIIDIANKSGSYDIRWATDVTNKVFLNKQERAGAIINKDILVLNIFRKDFSNILEKYLNDNYSYEIRFVKPFELPGIFGCIENLAKKAKVELKTDVYKLMCDGFSLNEKFKIFGIFLNDEALGFLSFHESYCTSSGKSLLVDHVYATSNENRNDLESALIREIILYAVTNEFSKIETSISRSQVKVINDLKRLGVNLDDNLRIASFNKNEFLKK